MIFRTLFGGPLKRLDPQKLPVPESFAEVKVMGRSARSVAVEQVGPKELVTSETVGRVGESAVFVYQTSAGRFRFAVKIVGVRDGRTVYELPDRVERLGGAPTQKRSSVRLDTLVQGFWRFAPGGLGVGEFQKGSIRDISRGGCALIANRRFKHGQGLEVKIALRSDAFPLTILAEVVRSEQIPSSGKFSHGLRFRSIGREEDQAILEFINRRQAELRSRGLA